MGANEFATARNITITKRQYEALFTPEQDQIESHKQAAIRTFESNDDARLQNHQDSEDTTKNWQQYAECLGFDPDLFYPKRGEDVQDAKDVCRKCMVREECLEYALKKEERFGIWGGLSTRERRRILRIRRNAEIAAALALEASQKTA